MKCSIYRHGGCYCAECEHHDTDGWCSQWRDFTENEDFCSRGELVTRVYDEPEYECPGKGEGHNHDD